MLIQPVSSISYKMAPSFGSTSPKWSIQPFNWSHTSAAIQTKLIELRGTPKPNSIQGKILDSNGKQAFFVKVELPPGTKNWKTTPLVLPILISTVKGVPHPLHTVVQEFKFPRSKVEFETWEIPSNGHQPQPASAQELFTFLENHKEDSMQIYVGGVLLDESVPSAKKIRFDKPYVVIEGSPKGSKAGESIFIRIPDFVDRLSDPFIQLLGQIAWEAKRVSENPASTN